MPTPRPLYSGRTAAASSGVRSSTQPYVLFSPVRSRDHTAPTRFPRSYPTTPMSSGIPHPPDVSACVGVFLHGTGVPGAVELHVRGVVDHEPEELFVLPARRFYRDVHGIRLCKYTNPGGESATGALARPENGRTRPHAFRHGSLRSRSGRPPHRPAERSLSSAAIPWALYRSPDQRLSHLPEHGRQLFQDVVQVDQAGHHELPLHPAAFLVL